MDIYKYGKNLRCGYTTGACAAAAAKAAADMLLNDSIVENTELVLKGSAVAFKTEDVTRGADWVKCAVRKDAGADIDVTDGLLIYAEVRRRTAGAPPRHTGRPGGQATGSRAGAAALTTDPGSRASAAASPQNAAAAQNSRIIIKGGSGVGTVTKAGLDQPPGEAAINSGPRRMITQTVLQVCDEADYDGALTVTISVPGGLEAAEKTFNPVLGIHGGISILGSTGIVEPMSEPALIETIRAEMRVKWLELSSERETRDAWPDTSQNSNAGCKDASGADAPERVKRDAIVIVPGNYGMKFAAERLGASENQMVKCSNFIGDALDYACELGIPEIVLAGNLGKLVKLAGGIFNTHSRNADCRMDIMMRCAFTAASELMSGDGGAKESAGAGRSGAEALCSLMAALNGCVTTDAALEALKSADAVLQGCSGGDACSDVNLLHETMRVIVEKAAGHIKRRCSGSENGMPRIRLIIISNDMDILSETVIE